MTTPPPPVLEMRGFGVAFGTRVVLADVNLDVAASGVTVLMGPVGVGKSTLLRTICGANDGSNTMRIWGEVHLLGEPVSETSRPVLVGQRAAVFRSSVRRALTEALPDRDRITQRDQLDRVRSVLAPLDLEWLVDDADRGVLDLSPAHQRQVMIIRQVLADPVLMCIDEPTAGMKDNEAGLVLALIEAVADSRPLLVVTHNQKRARRIARTVALLAGGRIIEQADVDAFFDAPRDPVAQTFVRSGSCSVPSPGTDPRHLDPDTPPPTRIPESARLAGVVTAPEPEPEPEPEPVTVTTPPPSGYHLIAPGLAGCPLPGLLGNLWPDLDGLRAAGTTVLVSLTETPFDQSVLAAYGIRGHHEPIRDMCPPTLAQAESIARLIEDWTESGQSVAVHCRAGLGRTGTVLASQLIWRGTPAAVALSQIRRHQPLYVQSQSQLSFLEMFADWRRRAYPDVAARASPLDV